MRLTQDYDALDVANKIGERCLPAVLPCSNGGLVWSGVVEWLGGGQGCFLPRLLTTRRRPPSPPLPSLQQASSKRAVAAVPAHVWMFLGP